VQWLHGRPAGVKVEDCLLFLGSSGQHSFLYDARTHETLRVPPSSVVIATGPDEKTCKKPVEG
jgi:hypothetical protein